MEWMWVVISIIWAALLYSWIEYFRDKYQVSKPAYQLNALQYDIKASNIYLEEVLHDESKRDHKKTVELSHLVNELEILEIDLPDFEMGSQPHMRVWSSLLDGLYVCAKQKNIVRAKKHLSRFKTGEIDAEDAQKLGLYEPI